MGNDPPKVKGGVNYFLIPIAETLVLRDLGRMDPRRQAIASEILTALTQLEKHDVELVHALVVSLAQKARR